MLKVKLVEDTIIFQKVNHPKGVIVTREQRLEIRQ